MQKYRWLANIYIDNQGIFNMISAVLFLSMRGKRKKMNKSSDGTGAYGERFCLNFAWTSQVVTAEEAPVVAVKQLPMS